MRFTFILAVSQLSTQLTHFLALKKTVGAIRASTMVTLAFIGLTALYDFDLNPTLHAACLGASFVGMSDPKRLGFWQLFFASIAFSIVFNTFIHYFKGLGGALGFSAFVSCIFIYLVSKTIRRFV